jgi:lipopolysaccharide transport system ATP-binding protein
MNAIELQSVFVDFPLYGIAPPRVDEKKHEPNEVGGRIIAERSSLRLRALDNVNLDVAAGERVGVFGKNGSGKSSLLRVIAGALNPTSGMVRRNGRVSAIIDITAGLETEANGYENVATLCLAYGYSLSFAKRIAGDVKKFSGLGSYMSLPVSCYSSGMVVRLALSTLLHMPIEILVLDEWLSVSDEMFNRKVQETLRTKIDEASCLVLASQDRRLLESACTKIICLNHGKIVSVEIRNKDSHEWVSTS